jgi:transcriptional regulator with PAS, ATPase and Fis domain
MGVDRKVRGIDTAERPASGFIVADPTMKRLVTLADRAAASDGKVLVTGESGVGKDVIARHIHLHSRRSAHTFVAVNCGGLTDSLLESELFGHLKGSFTGAYRDKPGKLQVAHRGTLFLDEVGEMSLRMQALLLRFLENGEIQAVGSDAPAAKVDVRVIAATNRSLPEMIAAGQFREDLLYRLRVIHLEVPPLRERPADIRLLVSHFTERIGRPVTVSEEALKLLERYRWPGNVRELQNVIEQTVWLTSGDVIEIEHLPEVLRNSGQSVLPMRERRKQVADELYQALVTSGYSFWEHIYPLFLSRDITRHDMRELVRRGLATTRGNYRALLKLFGMSPRDYKRFLNFLAAHGCRTDFREFRNGTPDLARRPGPVLPPLAEIRKAEPPPNPEASGGDPSVNGS